MKRASYREGIEIIALNDNCDVNTVDELVGTTTVFLLAHLFGVEQERVAADVIKFRKKHDDQDPKVGDARYRKLRQQLADAGDRRDGDYCDYLDTELVRIYGPNHDTEYCNLQRGGRP